MPANKGNITFAPCKEKSGNGFAAVTSKKKKRSCVKSKKHCKQYLQLHSEYRSTYTWHEYTGPHQEHTVVRRAPQAPPTSTKQAIAKLQSAKSTEDENIEGPTLEPPLPRRKKCPELAYKTHEFITAADGGGIDAVDTNVVADKVREVAASAALPPSQLSKAISRISTEYRLQFAWPRRSQLTNGDAVGPVAAAGGAGGTAGPPRKSLSMGALKQGIGPTGPAPVHKKRPGDVDHKRDGAQASELEPLVGHTDTVDGVVPEGDEREEEINEVKVTFRKKKTTDKGVTLVSGDNAAKTRRKLLGKSFPTSEMGELRRLADEYKHRDWGSGLASEEEVSLWKHVTNNHSLNALSLARSVTKEEKDKENTRKIAPSMTMPPAGRPSSVQARPSHGILQDDIKADNEKAIARARKDFLIRHHLDRTTGVGDGALLPSPTREKLEPVVPRRRDDSKEPRDEIQPKTKSSPKSSPRTGRSQSLGPMASERRSPKRQPPPRAPSVSKDAKVSSSSTSSSTRTSARKNASPDSYRNARKSRRIFNEKEKEQKDKEAREKSVEPERHPRPTAGGRGVRWSIREPSSIQYTTSSCSSTCEPPIPPLPPPPSGPGPTPLHKTRPSPRAHRKPFLATNAPPHRPVAHHQSSKPGVSSIGITNVANILTTTQTATTTTTKSTTGPTKTTTGQGIRGTNQQKNALNWSNVNTSVGGGGTSEKMMGKSSTIGIGPNNVQGVQKTKLDNVAKLEWSPAKSATTRAIKVSSLSGIDDDKSSPVKITSAKTTTTISTTTTTTTTTPARSAVPVDVVDKHPSKSSSLVDNRTNNAAALHSANAGLQAMTAEPQVNGDAGTGGESSVASTPQSQSAGSVVSAPIAASHVAPWVDDEPVVKSPPEPTRVKSPEQMIMRSPEPVNWTVPLDTGKTFTVTQNVREGEPLTRPHSEAKTWGGSSFPSAPQSAPPELAAQHKSQQHSQHSGYKSPESESVSLGSFSGLNGHKDLDSERDSPLPSNVHSTPTPTQSDKSSIIAGIEEVAVKEEQRSEQPVATSMKPVAGTNLRCLEDPVFEFERSKNAEGTSSVSAPAAGGTAASAAAAAAAAAAAGGTPSAQTGYRVLEAESPTGPGGASGAGTAAGYHVLGAPALSPGSAQRTVASDVLEKARNRFDKFWGKGGPENQA